MTRAAGFFALLVAAGGIGIATPTALSETFHVAIKAAYRGELANHQAALAARYGPRRRYDRLDRYKLDAGILRRFATELEEPRWRLVVLGLRLLAPDDLGPIPSGLPHDEAMVRLLGRYGLDTSDTAMLLEAQRAGVLAIVGLDKDMRRAEVDFDVYTRS